LPYHHKRHRRRREEGVSTSTHNRQRGEENAREKGYAGLREWWML
jgi:hypothetical protein